MDILADRVFECRYCSCHGDAFRATGLLSASERDFRLGLTQRGLVRISACTNVPTTGFGGVSRVAKGADCKSAG